MINKKGQGEVIFAWVLLIILLFLFFLGLLSPNYCDKLLILVSLFGAIWLFFGEAFFTRTEARGFVAFLPLTIVLFIIWLILKATGICTPISSFFKDIFGTLTYKP